MLQANVKKLDGTKLDHGNFHTEQAAMDWFQPLIDKGVYGQKYIAERFEDFQVLVTPAVYEETEILDENQQSLVPPQFEQVEITPAVYETENRKVQDEVLAAFVIEFTDVTQQLEQNVINEEAQQFLNESDWKIIRHQDQQSLGISTSLTGQELQDLLQERQMARTAIIK